MLTRSLYITEKKIIADNLSIKEKSYIRKVVQIAGGDGIRDVDRLVGTYPLQSGRKTAKKKWLKLRREAIVVEEETGFVGRAEVHWYFCDRVGKVEFKFKRWLT